LASADRIFVDTPVLLHAHDLDSGLKRAIAEQVLKQLWQDETGVLSTQVLQEFYAGLTAGLGSPVPRRAARDLVHAYAVWPVVTLDASDVLTASDFEERHRIPFRDALIITAARKSGATLILSDALQPHRPITGIELQNPFA
jgi:predicted nucleic acid-binding protein